MSRKCLARAHRLVGFFFSFSFISSFLNGLLKGTATIQGVGKKLLSITCTRQSILVSSIHVGVVGVLVAWAAIGKSHRNRPARHETSPIHPLNLSPRRRFLRRAAWGASHSAQMSPSPRPHCQGSRCFPARQRCPTAVFASSSGGDTSNSNIVIILKQEHTSKTPKKKGWDAV